MKRILLIASLGYILQSCGGPRSYQVESHAAGIGAYVPTANGTALMAAPMGQSPVQAEAAKAASFYGK